MTLISLPVKPGIVYILRNSAYRETVVKIGRTNRSSEVRAKELFSSTGVPEPFEVLYEEQVADCEAAERLIHRELSTYRVHQNREFFNVPLKVAVGAVFRTCLRVNQQFLREDSRLAILLRPNMKLPRNFAELLKPALGGSTVIRLILKSDTGSGQLDLGEGAMVKCTPEFLRSLQGREEFEEVTLYVPSAHSTVPSGGG